MSELYRESSLEQDNISSNLINLMTLYTVITIKTIKCSMVFNYLFYSNHVC